MGIDESTSIDRPKPVLEIGFLGSLPCSLSTQLAINKTNAALFFCAVRFQESQQTADFAAR